MGNSTDIIRMTEAERLQTVLNSYGYRPDRRMLADAGLQSLKEKQRKERISAQGAHHVVRRPVVLTGFNGEMIVWQFLGEEFISGTMQRKWVNVDQRKRFRGETDAVKAQKFRGEGEVVRESKIDIPGDQLGREGPVLERYSITRGGITTSI